MVAIGIDVGTTKITVVALDAETGNIRVIATQRTPEIAPRVSFEHLQNASEILMIVDNMLSTVDFSNVCVIGVTGQMHGIVYLDEDGKVISPLCTWQDERAAQRAKNGATYAAWLGVPSGYGHATHAYNVENGLVPPEAVGYCTIADAVVAHLCGIREPIVHATNAASLGCFEIEQSRFSDALPYPYAYRVVSDYHVAGTYRNIPVAVAIGDNQASFLGSGCADDDVLINIGTGSQVSRLSEETARNGAIESRPAFEGKILLVGSALCGGRAYAMLHDFFCQTVEMATGTRPDDLYERMDALLADAGDATLRFDNSFCGTRSEPWRRGSIQGIGEGNFTPRDFCIGILEGTVNELAELYGAMGCYTDHLIGSGNALRKNPLLCRMCEKRFGTRLTLPDNCEEAAGGAALFALISAGKLKNMREAKALLSHGA